jgi:gas vesicle structural protein
MTAPVSVVRSTPTSSGLYDVLDLILDKGLVIDAYVRVSVVGIELLTIDLRVVIASVDTYLRFAEAVDRLTLHEQGGKGLDDLMDGDDDDDDDDGKKKGKRGGGRRAVGSGDDSSSVKGAVKKVRDRVSGDDDDDEDGVVQKVRKAISGDDDEKKSNNNSRRRKSS